ncbi:hypothetical protein O181_031688 [Austropuccinia psidii MF-1]|uniref:Uncharacterized protein n=1 Tax=Austropuccinia psidii MF-1 TaxID=1389203 RepID=A0A9Q3CXZ7_9BASI|nr:hypothetical protein [Austropuccinia psidii MF-1]
MLPVHLRNLGIPRNKPEDRQILFRTRRPGTGHLGHNSGWQDTEENHTYSTIYLPIQQKPQKRGLEGYGSSSSAPSTPQRLIPMEHGQQEVQPSITLGRTWSKFPGDMSQIDTLKRSYGNHQRMEFQQRTIEPDTTYSDSFRLTVSRPSQLYSGFTPFRKQNISVQQSPLFTIPGSFQEKTRIEREKQDFFDPQAEGLRPNDPEVVGIGERSKESQK